MRIHSPPWPFQLVLKQPDFLCDALSWPGPWTSWPWTSWPWTSWPWTSWHWTSWPWTSWPWTSWHWHHDHGHHDRGHHDHGHHNPGSVVTWCQGSCYLMCLSSGLPMAAGRSSRCRRRGQRRRPPSVTEQSAPSLILKCLLLCMIT